MVRNGTGDAWVKRIEPIKNNGIIYLLEQKGIDYQCFMIHIDGVI